MGLYYPLPLPDLRQATADEEAPHDCGPAAASVVWSFLGVPAKPVPCNALDGTDPRTLEAVLRPELCVQAGEMALDDLRHHTTLGRPVVCLVRSGGTGHWVVVAGVRLPEPCPGPVGPALSSPRGLEVVFQDPLEGLRSASAGEFVTRWWDLDRWGFRYRCFGLAVWCPT